VNNQAAKWPVHTDDEIQAVADVLTSGKTNYWTGNQGREFEKEFAEYIGTKFSVALMNGTVALEAALYALDIGPGDEVITTCRTFIASASCIVMRGATPIIADVDINSQNISVETIEPCITAKTKAIIVVHLAGWPADMPAIMQLAKKYNLSVIEDCAQAHGAEINNQRVGSWGDIAAFSFCQDKIITTGGEGGMITTNNQKFWQKIWSYKDHGKSYDKVYNSSHPPGFRWLHDSFGTNWRMTEMQAAIGRLQLKKLNNWLAIRTRNANILTNHFKQLPALKINLPPANIKHAFYKYYVFVRAEQLQTGWDRDKILNQIIAKNIPCFTGSCSEIYLEQAFIKAKLNPAQQKTNARILGETSLMFLVDPTISEASIQHVAEVVSEIIELATIKEKICD